jgi:ATP-dependent Clp protease ATP-binding subunit ClpC
MGDRFDKFTDRARKVLTLAQEEAQRFNHNYIGTEHLLLGLVRESDGVAAMVLANMGVDLNRVRTGVEFIIGRGDRMVMGEIGLTPRAKKVIELSIDEARRLNHHYIGTEHLLLGLVREGEGIAAGVLESLGVSLDKVRAQVIHVLSEGSTHSSAPPGSSPPTFSTVQTFSLVQVRVDLTQAASARDLDPIFSWQMEIDRILEILGHPSKNNPVLVGEVGSVKSMVLRGLARRMVSGEIPETLRGKRLIVLEIGSFTPGALLRDVHDRRLCAAIDEVRRSQGRIIPVFDDLHLILGAAGVAEEANLLRTSLVRGELQCIGATTLGDFQALIARDPVLAERLEPVPVGEPTVEETVAILRGNKARFENYHRLEITDEALLAVADLAARHLPEGFLPDKVIDLVDEAATRFRRRQSEDAVSLKEATARLRDAIAAVQQEKESAIVSQQYELAAELRDREVKLRESMDRLQRSWQGPREPDRPKLTAEHIAELAPELIARPEPPPAEG